MDKKKLPLEQLKVKSFVTVMDSHNQKTAKGGYLDLDSHVSIYQDWTTIKTQKSVYTPEGGIEL